MNERIRKLKEQATSYKWDGYGEEEIEVIDAEKFAELIVQECIGLCNRLETCYVGDLNMTPNEIAKDTAESCAEIIGEHFGVK